LCSACETKMSTGCELKSCRECDYDLCVDCYDVEQSDCDCAHGLVSFIVGTSPSVVKFFCSLCDSQIPDGVELQSCRECDFEVCKECFDNEWYHEISGGRDFCQKDFLKLSSLEKEQFVKIETKNDMGGLDQNSYFEDEEE